MWGEQIVIVVIGLLLIYLIAAMIDTILYIVCDDRWR